MTLTEIESRVKAQAWQAIAQSDIDLSAVPRSELEKLVELVTDATIAALDDEIGLAFDEKQIDTSEWMEGIDPNAEKVLWEGRPLLSITTHYVITNQRVRIIHGLLGKEKEDIELVRIQDMDQKQTLRERVLSVGDVIIRSHDPSDPKIVLNNIHEPEQVHQILRQAVLEARDKYRLTYREEM